MDDADTVTANERKDLRSFVLFAVALYGVYCPPLYSGTVAGVKLVITRARSRPLKSTVGCISA